MIRLAARTERTKHIFLSETGPARSRSGCERTMTAPSPIARYAISTIRKLSRLIVEPTLIPEWCDPPERLLQNPL